MFNFQDKGTFLHLHKYAEEVIDEKYPRLKEMRKDYYDNLVIVLIRYFNSYSENEIMRKSNIRELMEFELEDFAKTMIEYKGE